MKTIVCLKWGDKYSPHYVNVLYNMCKRHSSSDFDFVCFTDNPLGLNANVIIKPLPNLSLHGWWYKPFIFSKENDLKGTVMFFDLDVVIYNNFDKFWTYFPNRFLIIRDFTRHVNPQWQKFNSSVFRFEAGQYHWIWEKFSKDSSKIMSRMHGDQDYLHSILGTQAIHWPDNWIQSYKWEMRSKLDLNIIHGKRNFIDDKPPKFIDGCSVAVFHGDPKPSDSKDKWVIEHWK